MFFKHGFELKHTYQFHYYPSSLYPYASGNVKIEAESFNSAMSLFRKKYGNVEITCVKDLQGAW